MNMDEDAKQKKSLNRKGDVKMRLVNWIMLVGLCLMLIFIFTNNGFSQQLDNTPKINMELMRGQDIAKHIKYNNSMFLLDSLVFPKLATKYPADVSSSVFINSATFGDITIVPQSATGTWAGEDNNLAQYQTDGELSFIEPQAGWTIIHATKSNLYVYDGSQWGAQRTDMIQSLVVTDIDGVTTPIGAPKGMIRVVGDHSTLDSVFDVRDLKTSETMLDLVVSSQTENALSFQLNSEGQNNVTITGFGDARLSGYIQGGTDTSSPPTPSKRFTLWMDDTTGDLMVTLDDGNTEKETILVDFSGL